MAIFNSYKWPFSIFHGNVVLEIGVIFLQVERDKKLLQKKLADADAAKKGVATQICRAGYQ